MSLHPAPSQGSNLDLGTFFHATMDEHMRVARATKEALSHDFERLVACCLTSLSQGGKLIFFGNGGSAADAQHLATEFTVRFSQSRAPMAALALTTDTSTLTAIGNDMGFEHLFSRQIEAMARPEDVIIAISTSGTSPNIIKALEKAREMGLTTTALGGRDGGRMKGLADILLIVPSMTTAHIQEMHITLGQMLCAALETSLGLV